ncbi:MAG: betaine/proline/choline family ABC transporter ATP-binding protein [Acidimicrobiia bacterium]
MPQNPMIVLDAVTKRFRGSEHPAVDQLSLSINEGEVVVLVGPSGCGKTTTLKMINRLIEPTGGRIAVGGKDILELPAHELRRGIGYVIQQIGLFPHRTIAENICTVPTLLGWSKQRIAERVDELTELVDLEPEMLQRYPAELSGGQRQRVGVARALAADPPVLLMDEPFGAVDPIVRGRLQEELLALQQTLHKTIVLVTHDIDEAIMLGDRVAILNIGGHLEQYDEPSEILREPANSFVANFLGTDRGIKRLSLIPISSIELDRGPVVDHRASARTAAEVMAEYDVDWAAIVEGERLRGWFSSDDLANHEAVADIELRPFLTSLDISDTLRDALDVVVSTHTSVAAVLDGDRYLGMVTIDSISSEIVQ